MKCDKKKIVILIDKKQIKVNMNELVINECQAAFKMLGLLEIKENI